MTTTRATARIATDPQTQPHVMPKLPDGWCPPAGYTVSACPVCEARTMRSVAIPDDELATCTTCAMKVRLADRSRNS